MKKKLLIIFLILFTPFIVNADPKKGDLRCPVKELDGASCTETKDQNGTVISTRITKKQTQSNGSYAMVSKIVSKVSDELGRYKVEFEISGKNVATSVAKGDAYIIIGFDTSTTMNKEQFDVAKGAIKSFANKLCPDNTKCEYNIMLVQFAKKPNIRRSFEKKNLDDFNDFYEIGKSAIGTTSELGEFYKLASEKFNTLPANAQKYVVVFGDGMYYYGVGCDILNTSPTSETNHTNCNTVREYKAILENQKVKMYGIKYRERRWADIHKSSRRACAGKSFDWCDELYMKKYVSETNYFSALTTEEFESKFLEAAAKIESTIDNKTETVSSTLTDKLGYNFTILNQGNATKSFEIKKISETVYRTEPFYIEINRESETKTWHATNDGFKLIYKINGKDYELTSNLNPEVYWILNENKINSCYGSAFSDSISSSNETYYSKYCQEGYLDNYEYKNGLITTIRVNKVAEGTKKFTLPMGMGFPIEVNLETNIKCTYNIDYNKMQQEKKNLTNLINRTTDAKEKASLQKKLNNLEKSFSNYQELVKNDLEDYVSRFTNQTARLKIYYKSNGTDSIVLENKGDIKYQLNCGTPTKINDVITNQTCYIYLAKDMQLPTACLEMQDGEQAKCSSSNTQINGGNNFYVKMKEQSGRIYVEVNEAGYDMGTNVETNECNYDVNGKLNVTFRQVELTDPFLTSYDPKRKIGDNYKNDHYNFSKIIKADIWEKTADYRFSLSKINVSQIKKDSGTSTVSYLGTDCRINTDKKYVCSFFDKNNSFFSKVELNND